jgi:hypothetical protein
MSNAQVICYPDTGGPLTLAEIDDRLNEHGIYQQAGDTGPDREEVAPPSEWTWAAETSGYVATMIACWATDKPEPGAGRNPWFYGKHIRLECAHRLGLVTEADHHEAKELLARRLPVILHDPSIGIPREPKRYEIADMRKHAVTVAAAKTDEQAHAELGGHTHNDGPAAGFDEPIPLTQTTQIPAFPVDALPAPIADMVRAVSESTQTDAAMAATSGLSTISACTGGHAVIEVRPGWREPLNIYTVPIAAPGERKSAVQATMVHPIFDVEQQLGDAGLSARLEALTRKEVAENAAEQSKRDAARKANTDSWDTALADAIGAAQIADAIEVPSIPRIVADDITPEAAASLLAEQGGRLAIISAEGGIFDIIAGRYSGNVPNLDLWLKGHSGDPLKIDRKNRPPEYVRRPAVTLGLMIQPDVLRTIAGNRQFRGRGLLARFLYAYPESMVGHRRIAATPVPADVRERYETAIRDLAAGLAGWLSDPAVLTLTEAAGKAVIAIETAVEPTLAGDGELAPLADWGSKYVGAIVRIAGMLHLAEHGSDAGPTTSVSAQTIHSAHRIGTYFKACAIRAFSEIGTDHVTADAVYLLDRIARLYQDTVSERDLMRAAKRFKKKDDLLPAIARLVDHGYLLPLPSHRSTGGRPASPVFKVHPMVTEGT